MNEKYKDYPIFGEYMRLLREGTIDERIDFVMKYTVRLSYESIMYDASKNGGIIPPEHKKFLRTQMGGEREIHRLD